MLPGLKVVAGLPLVAILVSPLNVRADPVALWCVSGGKHRNAVFAGEFRRNRYSVGWHLKGLLVVALLGQLDGLPIAVGDSEIFQNIATIQVDS